jgi:hypothetical protein
MRAKTCKSWIFQNTTRIGLAIQLDRKDHLLCKEWGEEFLHHDKKFPLFREVSNCVDLGWSTPFGGVCFGHAFSKAYQQATIETKFLEVGIMFP